MINCLTSVLKNTQYLYLWCDREPKLNVRYGAKHYKIYD
jgi:hypothetical protein